ncbi:MAG: fumarate hydratase C-terminal domain-containing protein, partial [Candidatus Omnitrophica bacterium]|nr:fumarate hydratase C-terminal domain-containing protein [Candidatus Omnitrophota bacterium]
MKEITLAKNKDIIQRLKAGDQILFSGIFCTARDQAHQRIVN